MAKKECKDYEEGLKQKNKEVFQYFAGKAYFSEEEYWAALDEMGRLKQKWIEQNDIEKLFGVDNQNFHSIGTEEENELEYGLSHKIIFRSIDNKYFITDEECKIHEEKIKGQDLTKIIDKERVWLAKDSLGLARYFATQEECLLFERTADDGKIFDTAEEKKQYEEEIARLDAQAFLEGEAQEAMEAIKKEKQDREMYGVHWGDEDYSLNEERLDMEEEEYWNKIDGTPN